jgi:hypothetical protein
MTVSTPTPDPIEPPNKPAEAPINPEVQASNAQSQPVESSLETIPAQSEDEQLTTAQLPKPEAPPPSSKSFSDSPTQAPTSPAKSFSSPPTQPPVVFTAAEIQRTASSDDETMPQRPSIMSDTHHLSEAEIKAYIEARRKRNLKKTATNVEPTRSGVLRLELLETRQSIMIPIKEKITLGRPDPVTGKEPDVDFTTLAGYRMGVSRYHAEIHWQKDNVLQVCDLGSSNGTFVNNERLQPNVPRNVYNGDEVRLGQLGLYIYYEIQEEATIIPFRGSHD